MVNAQNKNSKRKKDLTQAITSTSAWLLNGRSVLTLALLFFTSLTFASFLNSGAVLAWCDNSNKTSAADCGYDLGTRNKVPSSVIDQCAGSPPPKDAIARCGNAAQLCSDRTIDKSACLNPKYLSAIADKCQDGRGTDSDTCTPINNENLQQTGAVDKTATDNVKNTCIIDEKARKTSQEKCEQFMYSGKDCKASPVGLSQAGAPVICTDSVQSTCRQKAAVNNARDSKVDIDKYKKCVNDAVKTSATTKDQCESKERGGVWDSKENKCRTGYGDIKDQEACKNAKGTWDEKAKTCNAPASTADSGGKKCNDGSDPGKDGKCADGSTPTGTGSGSSSSRYKAEFECGGAKTNLIACDKDKKGIEALGEILKIALSVLTVIVGIAATGGIAYSAVLYAGAQDNAGNTQKAKEMIRNIVIGLIAYGFMIAIITWLVPAMNIKS